MILFGVVWLLSLLTLLLLAISYAATIPLMRRREPDPPQHPSTYGMAAENVSFPSRDGVTLGGWWITPDGPTRDTVLICSGQNGSMDKDVRQALPLHEAAFNVLLFDWRAHGASEGETVTLGALEQADLFGALDFLQGERGIDTVGILGLSMGAGVALLVAAQDARIGALVVDGAWPRLAGLLAGYIRQRGVPTLPARAFARIILLMASLRTRYELYRANPIEWAHRITAPVLFVHGDEDPFVSPGELAALAARPRGPVEVWRLPGTGHRRAYEQHTEAYNQRVVAWFRGHLALRDEPNAR